MVMAVILPVAGERVEWRASILTQASPIAHSRLGPVRAAVC
jgi:hypothetical protein